VLIYVLFVFVAVLVLGGPILLAVHIFAAVVNALNKRKK
jgi:hypothetical protein